MAEPKKEIFRKDALEGLASPERLDELVRIVGRPDWILLATMGVLVAAALTWSVFGRLPMAVSGLGVLIYPGGVVPFQAPAAGRLMTLAAGVGTRVKKGDELATIDLAETRRQVFEARRQLGDLEAQDRDKSALEREQVRLQSQDIDAQHRFYLLLRDNRQQSLRHAEQLAPLLATRLTGQQALKKEGLIPEMSEELLTAQKEHLENEAAISNLRAEVAEVESQLKELEIRQRDLAQKTLESSTSRRNEMQRLAGTISVFDAQLERSGRIVSAYSGTVLEVSVTPGEMVSEGARLGSLAVEGSSAPLRCHAYFPVGDGKRIQAGMRVQVIPDTVPRERFGGIVGRVLSVSRFPVTREAAAAVIGSQEVAARLFVTSPCIEVVIALETDPAAFSGFRWTSSRGPAMKMSAGTTTANRVTVEERAPITYLLPFLRSASGIY